MSTRLAFALTAYLAVWAAMASGIVYGAVQAGYSAWVGVTLAFLMFLVINGSLAYRARVRQLRSEGKEPPKYLQYLFFPEGPPKFKDAAPRSTHVLVGVAAALTGIFFVFCGVALALDGDWSRVSEPVLVAATCIVLVGIGLAFLYLAWRLLSFGRSSPANVA